MGSRQRIREGPSMQRATAALVTGERKEQGAKSKERDRLLTKKRVTILGALGLGGSKQQIKALRLFGALQPPRKLLLDLVPLLKNQACLYYWGYTKDIGIHSLESLVAGSLSCLQHKKVRTHELSSFMFRLLQRLHQCVTKCTFYTKGMV